MATLENVEKLREYAKVSYDEAREALDACDGDILEAIIYLEKKGMVDPPKTGGTYTTDAQTPPPPPQPEYKSQPESFGQLMRRFWGWLRSVIRRGNQNLFEVHRNDNLVMSLPVTLLVILILVAFWVTLPLLIIGLFFGFRYSFRGRDLDKTPANKVMNTVASAAEDIKSSFQAGHSKDDKK